MDNPDLNVHDILVSDTTIFTPAGAALAQRRVTFSVGTHGPFSLTYDKAAATPAVIKKDIQQQVDDLREIHQISG